MNVLITRPVEDCEPLKSQIEALGCMVMLSPLIEIVPNEIAASDLDGATAVIATSANALSAIGNAVGRDRLKHVPLYAVGPATAATAQAYGFETVIEGPGRASDLVPLVSQASSESLRRVLYLRGETIAFDLETALSDRGISAVPIVSYRSIAREALSSSVIKALQSGSIDVVTLMSPRTARIWAQLGAVSAPPECLARLSYACLSERVGDAVAAIAQSGKIRVASHPDIDGLVTVVKRLAADRKAE
jgi:uroporphyrinogen-III synthase